jgi:hypothetical protein
MLELLVDLFERLVGPSGPQRYLGETLPKFAGEVETGRKVDLLEALGGRVDLAAQQVRLRTVQMQ